MTEMNPLAALALYLDDLVEIKLTQKNDEVMKAVLARIDKLKTHREVPEDVRRIIQQRNAYLKVNYRKLRPSFDKLQDTIFQIIVTLTDIDGKPISYDEIIEAAKTKDEDLKAETVARRVRELRAQGFIYEPVRGRFLLTSKEEKTA